MAFNILKYVLAPILSVIIVVIIGSYFEICLSYIASATVKSLQSCPTLCDPIDGSPQGSLSLGFSRQEHWNGLPFPSPMHESEKRK